MILRDLLDAWPLAPIAAGVALLLLYGRDPKTADEHTVDDYRPTLAPERRNWPLVDASAGPRRLRPNALDVLPPAPAGTTGRASLYSKLYAEQVVAEQMRGRYGTTSPDVIAGRMLREIAGIRPAYATADRDMTGAFPVVRAA